MAPANSARARPNSSCRTWLSSSGSPADVGLGVEQAQAGIAVSLTPSGGRRQSSHRLGILCPLRIEGRREGATGAVARRARPQDVGYCQVPHHLGTATEGIRPRATGRQQVDLADARRL